MQRFEKSTQRHLAEGSAMNLFHVVEKLSNFTIQALEQDQQMFWHDNYNIGHGTWLMNHCVTKVVNKLFVAK